MIVKTFAPHLIIIIKSETWSTSHGLVLSNVHSMVYYILHHTDSHIYTYKIRHHSNCLVKDTTIKPGFHHLVRTEKLASTAFVTKPPFNPSLIGMESDEAQSIYMRKLNMVFHYLEATSWTAVSPWRNSGRRRLFSPAHECMEHKQNK